MRALIELYKSLRISCITASPTTTITLTALTGVEIDGETIEIITIVTATTVITTVTATVTITVAVTVDVTTIETTGEMTITGAVTTTEMTTGVEIIAETSTEEMTIAMETDGTIIGIEKIFAAMTATRTTGGPAVKRTSTASAKARNIATMRKIHWPNKSMSRIVTVQDLTRNTHPIWPRHVSSHTLHQTLI